MNAVVEADFVARLPVMSNHVSLMILSILLVFVWARSRLVHMCSWQSHVNGPCYAPNTGLTMQHVYGPSGNLGNE